MTRWSSNKLVVFLVDCVKSELTSIDLPDDVPCNESWSNIAETIIGFSFSCRTDMVFLYSVVAVSEKTPRNSEKKS